MYEYFGRIYYGNFSENDRKVPFDKKALKKEFALYDRLKAQLTEAQLKTFNEYIELASDRVENEAKERYIAGFKHGVWLGIEVSILDCDYINRTARNSQFRAVLILILKIFSQLFS